MRRFNVIDTRGFRHKQTELAGEGWVKERLAKPLAARTPHPAAIAFARLSSGGRPLPQGKRRTERVARAWMGSIMRGFDKRRHDDALTARPRSLVLARTSARRREEAGGLGRRV